MLSYSIVNVDRPGAPSFDAHPRVRPFRVVAITDLQSGDHVLLPSKRLTRSFRTGLRQRRVGSHSTSHHSETSVDKGGCRSRCTGHFLDIIHLPFHRELSRLACLQDLDQVALPMPQSRCLVSSNIPMRVDPRSSLPLNQ